MLNKDRVEMLLLLVQNLDFLLGVCMRCSGWIRSS